MCSVLQAALCVASRRKSRSFSLLFPCRSRVKGLSKSDKSNVSQSILIQDSLGLVRWRYHREKRKDPAHKNDTADTLDAAFDRDHRAQALQDWPTQAVLPLSCSFASASEGIIRQTAH